MTKTQHTRIVKLLAKGTTQANIAEQVGVTRYFVSQTKLGRINLYPKAKPATGKKASKRATPQKTIKKAAKKRGGTRKAAKRRSRH